MEIDEVIKHCLDEADSLGGSEMGLEQAQIASWLQHYKELLKERKGSLVEFEGNRSKRLMWAAQISLMLQDINIPKSFLSGTLQQMADAIKTMDKEANETKEISYCAQILHSALLSIQSAEDAVSGLSLLMYKDMKL